MSEAFRAEADHLELITTGSPRDEVAHVEGDARPRGNEGDALDHRKRLNCTSEITGGVLGLKADGQSPILVGQGVRVRCLSVAHLCAGKGQADLPGRCSADADAVRSGAKVDRVRTIGRGIEERPIVA